MYRKWIVGRKWKLKTHHEVANVALMRGNSSLELIGCTEELHIGVRDIEESNVWELEQVKGW